MTRDQLISLVQNNIPEVKLGVNKQFPEFIVNNDQIHLVCKTLRENNDTQMDFLFCQTAADRKDGFHVIYHLTSTTFSHSAMLRVVLSDKVKPEIETVSDIWKAAEFYEREIFDLFGVHFNHHPDLRRIFLDESWVGHPLRKDYKDDFIIAR